MLALSSLCGWVLADLAPRPSSALTVRALQLLGFGTGGVGTVVLFGLLIAGIAITGSLHGLLARWLGWSGALVGLICELATLTLLLPGAVFLLPLGRFAGLLWLLVAAFRLPATRGAQHGS
jgi:hypothetical protein